MPDGLLRTVVPAAPDAWITALERFGTLGFAEVAQPAIECARDGFPLGPFVARIIGDNEAAYRRWPTSAPIFLPGGRAPRPGERFVQADLGRTLTYLADEDRAGRRPDAPPGSPPRAMRFTGATWPPPSRATMPRRAGSSRRTTSPGSASASSRRCEPRLDPARW